MSKNILQDIINKKKRRLIELKKKRPLESLLEHPCDSMGYYNFKEEIEKNIQKNKISIIAEIKKASPSAGIIIENYNPVEIANIYKDNKATCLSVLTEEDFFLGNLAHIYKIKLNSTPMIDCSGINLPVLCKDFFIDTYQLHLAKYYGADAILVILACVDEKTANNLYEEALKSSMSVIVEIHTKEEAVKAVRFKEAIIGINNRNLKTLKININTTFDLYKIIEIHGGPFVSESGIQSKDDVLKISEKTNIKTFLIGESLLKNLNNNSIFSVL